MPQTSQLVSIILPVRDGARYLAQALDSVRAQAYQPTELIVVDGGSTDGSDEIAQSYHPDQLIRQVRPGLWAALNLGLTASRGQYVAFISSDDRWTPDKLARQAAYLDQHAEIQMVIGDVIFFVAEGHSRPPGFRQRLINTPHPYRVLEVLLARRSLFTRLGPLNENLTHGADTDWFARAQEARARLAALPGVLLYKRLHDRNYSLSAPGEQQQFLLQILRQSLNRRDRPTLTVTEPGEIESR